MVHDHMHSVLNKLFRLFSDMSTGVHIKDLLSTRKKMETLIIGGSKRLQVVSDFDHTMSKHRHNGKFNPTCHGLFASDPELTDETRAKIKKLVQKYHPIEVDPLMSDSEKIPYMIEWWELSHEVILECNLHRDMLVKTVQGSGMVLRDGVTEWTQLLERNDIPLLIFSAGLGDVINILIDHFGIRSKNMHVISNLMKFDENDVIVGFTEPIIHTFNKTAASIADCDYTRMSVTRPCVLLLGDSTGDVHMADGATQDDPEGDPSGTVLRIGFLNDKVDEMLEKYKNIYDIVIVNNETFSIPLAIVKSVIEGNSMLFNDANTLNLFPVVASEVVSSD